MKIRLEQAELFHEKGLTGKQTDRHDVSNSHFSQYFQRT